MDIKQIQKEKIKKLYFKLLEINNADYDKLVYNSLLDELDFSTENILSGHYRTPKYGKFDYKNYNLEIGLIKIDIESIYEYLNSLQISLSEMEFLIDVWNIKIENSLNKLNKKYNKLTEINLLDEVLTTNMVINNGLKLNKMDLNKHSYLFSNEDMVLKPISNIKNLTKIGEYVNILNDSNNSLIIESEFSSENMEFELIVNLHDKLYNSISIDLNKPNVGLKTKIEIGSANSYKVIYDKTLNTNNINVTFPVALISNMKITFSMSMPNVIKFNKKIYQIILNDISFFNNIINYDNNFLSKIIPLNKNINSLQLITDNNSNTEYKLTITSDLGETTQIIKPNEVINIKTIKNNIPINYGIATNSCIELNEYDFKLYNILNDMEIDNNISIEDNKFKVTNILFENIKFELYGGISSFYKTSNKIDKNVICEKISYSPQLIDNTQELDDVKILFKIIKEQIIINDESATLKYEIVNDNILIYNENFKLKKVNDIVINNDGSITITDLPNGIYYISYLTNYKNFTENKIIKDIEFNITVKEDTLVENEDYLILENDGDLYIKLLDTGIYMDHYFIEINETTGEFKNLSNSIIVDYKFIEKDGIIEDIYTTYILTNNICTLNVLYPLTKTEIDNNEFIKINDKNILMNSTVELKNGWNKITTSLPFNNDKTQYRIDFNNENIKKHRAYLNPMNKVEPFILKTKPYSETLKCYSIDENGKLLLSYNPKNKKYMQYVSIDNYDKFNMEISYINPNDITVQLECNVKLNNQNDDVNISELKFKTNTFNG